MADQSFDHFLAQADTAARGGDWAAAQNYLMQAIQIDPEHPGALTGIGTCLMQMQRAQEALPFFEQVIRLEPQSADAYNNLGVAYAMNNQMLQAEQSYQKAIQISPEGRQAWKNLALLYLQQEARMAEGVQILASLVQADPNDTDVLILLGQCYEMADEFESARVLYQKALDVQPDLATAGAALTRIAEKMRDATRIARPEHAQKLAALKNLKKKSDH